jgi:hypothetical protein
VFVSNALTCDNESSPRGASNTAGGSNPQIAYTIGGLGVSLPTHIQDLSAVGRRALCKPWEGRPSEYQFEARDVLQRLLNGGQEIPWIYIVPMCGTKLCLTRSHLRMFRARKIAYPPDLCIYCGMPGYTRDHLLPVTMTGEAQRKFVAVVPACGECNSGIGDRVGHRITERREEAHRVIEKKHRKTLEIGKRWTASELAELGPNLRTHIERALVQREILLRRLAWPLDPEYDKRAFQKTGFDDPIGQELL